jgi:MAF protein
LLAHLGPPFEVDPAAVDEELHRAPPVRLARQLATVKARAVAARRPHATVLAADTIVAYHGRLFGKPVDADEARAMLEFLGGRTHRVITAVAVLLPGRRRPLIDHVVTSVTMRRLSGEEIAASIARGDPFDKAGAYGIQDELLAPVTTYDGCYCNVMGLPLWTSARLLGRAGLDITHVGAADLLPQCAECCAR